MESKYKVAVIGGTGKSGQFLVLHLLNQGIPIKMLLRNPENFHLKSPLIEIIRGDARDPRAVYSLIEGCSAVISTLGQPKNDYPSDGGVPDSACCHATKDDPRIVAQFAVTGAEFRSLGIIS